MQHFSTNEVLKRIIDKEVEKELSYYYNLEKLVKQFIEKYGYGIKSDDPDYGQLISNEDVIPLKRHIESRNII